MRNWYQTFKWPLLLILACILLGFITFYAFSLLLSSGILFKLCCIPHLKLYILDNEINWNDPDDKSWTSQTEPVFKLVPNSENKFWTIFNKSSLAINSSDSKMQSLKEISFTSGHQNSFGVPLEEDERILKMFLNEDFIDEPKVRFNN